MKLYVYHWMCKELDIPGVYQEGKAQRPDARPPHWLDVPDEEIGKKLLELADNYDVMLLGPTESFEHYKLYIDRRGGRFRQR